MMGNLELDLSSVINQKCFPKLESLPFVTWSAEATMPLSAEWHREENVYKKNNLSSGVYIFDDS